MGVEGSTKTKVSVEDALASESCWWYDGKGGGKYPKGVAGE